MATVKSDFTAKFQTSKDAEMEETHFHSGDAVTIVQKWEHFLLIKDANGHFYNVPVDKIAQ